jgi:succinoglycan biosynthesis transport protein ExoP
MIWAALAVMALAGAAAFFWPPTYRSTGTILIEQQEVPTELVRSAITSYADQRIQVITQRVMTTENLFRIIDRYGLYAAQRAREPREKIISRMRDDVNFEMISADVIDPRVGRPTKATIAFSVSFQHRSADVAARVANELVSLYMSVNIETRKQDAANASSFLGDESGRLSKRIDELQGQMAKFKEQHMDELPELAALNTQMLSRSEDELRELETRQRSLDQQITFLDAQLAQINPNSQIYASTGERVMSQPDRLKYLRSEYARASGLYSPTHPDVLRLKREIDGLEAGSGYGSDRNDLARQLEEASTQLASAREKYSPGHPDVQKLDRLVQSLTAALAQAKASAAGTRASEGDNPAYISLRSQREAAVNERSSLEGNRRQLRAKLADLENRLAKAPAVERDYASLSRELENNQLKYRDVRQKQMEAQVSQNLEDERKGERFTLIEPPTQPEQPASPNRVAIALAGAVLALAAGVGLGLLLEQLDTSIRSRRDLELLLSVPPLAVVPWIETGHDRRARRLHISLGLASAAGAVLLALALTHVFYRPLDVLWQVALRRLSG